MRSLNRKESGFVSETKKFPYIYIYIYIYIYMDIHTLYYKKTFFSIYTYSFFNTDLRIG